MEAGAHIGRRIPASAGDSAELLGYGRDGAFVVSVSDEDDDAISPVPLEPEPEPQADDEAVELTGFGPLACNTQRQAEGRSGEVSPTIEGAARRAERRGQHYSTQHSTPAGWLTVHDKCVGTHCVGRPVRHTRPARSPTSSRPAAEPWP